jgi:hypothetical protein
MQLIMHKALRRAIDDLYALSQVADREDAERIRDIIERLQALDEQGDEQTDVYIKLLRP